MPLPETGPDIRRTPRIWIGLALVLLLAARDSGSPSPPPTAPPQRVVAREFHHLAEGPAEAPAGSKAHALARLGVPAWHARGWRGQGVTVAILDSGFRGYREHLGKALPARVTARSFRLDKNLEARDSQHGILCAEVIHAIAPAARLLFANWEPEHPQTFLDAVRWARLAGASVISCSIIMPSWSDGEGRGPVHRALAEALKGDLLFFAAAGNTARRHWGGEFHAGPAAPGVHEWVPGVTENPLDPWDERRISVEVCAPFPVSADPNRPSPRFRVVVTERPDGPVVARATTPARPRRVGHTCGVASFTPRADHKYAVRVERLDPAPGPRSAAFHLTVLGGNLGHPSRWGSIPFPGDGSSVLAVGALGPDDRRRDYSSCGPHGAGPGTPAFAAPVPFPSAWRERPFSGTSAAAPQAAALAALMWSRHPDWKAGAVRRALCAAARPVADSHPEPETGHGRLCLP